VLPVSGSLTETPISEHGLASGSSLTIWHGPPFSAGSGSMVMGSDYVASLTKASAQRSLG
jgi:hypothetical protein